MTLAADYRFGYINYFYVDNNSYTHFLLGGLDYSFSPRLHGGFRAGVEFRSYVDTSGGDETSPYLEGNLAYDINRVAHLSALIHYAIEEGDLSVDASKADTLSLGLQYDQSFTARLSGYVGFNYSHAVYGSVAPDSVTIAYGANGFSEDTFDVAVGARFAISRHFSAEVGYTHTTVLSQVDVRAYDRNRVFGGVRFSF